MQDNNLSPIQTVNIPVQTLNFIFPKGENLSNPLLQFLYSENHIDKPAKSTCRRCKVKRTRRTCAEGQFGRHGNLCYIAFDFCSKCLRVKPDSPHQKKMMELVSNIRPLTKKYVFIQNKFRQARAEGRLVLSKSEYDAWLIEFNNGGLVTTVNNLQFSAASLPIVV